MEFVPQQGCLFCLSEEAVPSLADWICQGQGRNPRVSPPSQKRILGGIGGRTIEEGTIVGALIGM